MFITLEGVDGSGKTTLMNNIAKWLLQKNYQVHTTFEPTNWVRKIIFEQDLEPQTEALLFSADRIEHVQKEIYPKVQEGNIVLCDRFQLSTFAYQYVARESINLEEYTTLEHLGETCIPDITFFIDITPEVCLSRAVEQTKFEKAGLDFQKKVYQGYKQGVHWYNTLDNYKIITLDGNGSPDFIFGQAITHLKNHLNFQ